MLDKFDVSISKIMSTALVNHFKFSMDQFPKTDAKVEYILKSLMTMLWVV